MYYRTTEKTACIPVHASIGVFLYIKNSTKKVDFSAEKNGCELRAPWSNSAFESALILA